MKLRPNQATSRNKERERRQAKALNLLRQAATPKRKPDARFEEVEKAFSNTVLECMELSRQKAGIKAPTGRHWYASVLFTVMCTRAISLGILLPGSIWSRQLIEHWDGSSIAGLARSLLEVRLAFQYLCVEQVSEEVWELRWNLFNLHDCSTRFQIANLRWPGGGEVLEIEKQAAELRQRLEANPEFTKIPEKRRRSLLKGENPYLSSLEDIAEGIGIEKATYRWLNKIFSNHVHSYPFSFYRMREENLSRGERSPSEESNIRLCISTSLLALVTARDAMESLFAGLTQDPEYLAAISKATKPQ